MANTDYRISLGWRRNRKRQKLLNRLECTGVLAVMDLWGAVAEDAPEGRLSGWSEEDICIAAGWGGDVKLFVNTLLDLKLIEHDDVSDCYVIHDWVEHNHWAAHSKQRSKKAREAAMARWGTDAGSMQAGSEEHAESMGQDCGEQSSLPPNQTKPGSNLKKETHQPPPLSPEHVAEDECQLVEEYVRLLTKKMVHAGEIRTSEFAFSEGIRRKIAEEGGRLTSGRKRELANWVKEEAERELRKRELEQREADSELKERDLLEQMRLAAKHFEDMPLEEQKVICQKALNTSELPSDLTDARVLSKIAEAMGALN